MLQAGEQDGSVPLTALCSLLTPFRPCPGLHRRILRQLSSTPLMFCGRRFREYWANSTLRYDRASAQFGQFQQFIAAISRLLPLDGRQFGEFGR